MPVKTLQCHHGNRFPGRLSAPSLSTRSACVQSPTEEARALLGAAADAGRGHVIVTALVFLTLPLVLVLSEGRTSPRSSRS